MIRNFEVLRSVIERVGSVRRGRGEGGARAGRLFLLAHEEGLSFKPKYWANLFKCIFFVLFFCLLFFALPWLDQLAVLFFTLFLYGLLVPYLFSENFLKSFLEEIFLSPCTSKHVPPFQKSNWSLIIVNCRLKPGCVATVQFILFRTNC